jgi:hypothetical protein
VSTHENKVSTHENKVSTHENKVSTHENKVSTHDAEESTLEEEPLVPFDPEDTTVPDDSMQEIADLNPQLNDKERRYIYWRSMANPPIVAYRKAGFSGSSWRQVETRPRVRETLVDLHEKLEPQYRVSLQKVVGMIMSGYEMAQLKGQPKVMVEAATALANITGLAAAQKVQIDQRTTGVVQHQHEVRALQHLPRESLELLVGIQRQLPYIEAEFVDASVE